MIALPALADAVFSGPADDASALKLAVREIEKGPAGRRAVVLITTGPVSAGLVAALAFGLAPPSPGTL